MIKLATLCSDILSFYGFLLSCKMDTKDSACVLWHGSTGISYLSPIVGGVQLRDKEVPPNQFNVFVICMQFYNVSEEI